MNPDIASNITQSEKIISRFGHWPSFHDAEVVELSLWRGRIHEEKGEYIFPVLTLKLHHWLLTKKVDEKGFLVSELHTLSSIRFDGVEEFSAQDFNHQNAIFSLGIEKKKKPDSDSWYFAVTLEPSFGVDAKFTCSAIEVLESLPSEKNGIQTA